MVAKKQSFAKRGTTATRFKRFGPRQNNFKKKEVMRSTSHSDAVTKLNFHNSLTTKSPIPDRYFCWMVINETGVYPGAITGTFSFGLNTPFLPFNTFGGGNSIPSPGVAINSLNPYGMRNLLYNAGQGTGLWLNYRVWSVKVKIITTANVGSNVADNATMTPVIGNALFSSQNNAALAPHSVTSTSTGYNNINVLEKMYSIPDLQGISKTEYAAYSANSYGNAATAPGTAVYLQHIRQSVDNATSVSFDIRVECSYHIEFFQNGLTTLLTV